ncbi:MAG: hypothetical protein HOV71_23580 [Hamadaea sp.]|uniref:hypothetical protein n=1 Tax=Hamadaea sp. NPDC050747 TaxID=3155789 RepID=UPI0018142A66|nr:hypothetical protein [Hamadaea sp.]NUR51120.1 hypothetical protein [Hamadaea sp.]NUT05526.1 hypothetical protein [Hamadaea sp.]
MNTTVATEPVRVEAYSDTVKKLGDWTAANRFEVRGRSGYALLDLRSPRIVGDVEIRVHASRSTIKLLVPEDAVIDQWDLTFRGRGTVKDWEHTKGTGSRRVRLVGEIENGEVRIVRGGIAILTAMFSREFVDDCVRAHRAGGRPTVHDPADTHA